MKRTDRRSDCPTNHAVEVLGDSWSLLIVRDLMFKKKRTYGEFAASAERISSNILASRLRSLERDGIIRRSGRGRATTYALTPKGIDLVPLMIEMILWAKRHDADTSSPPFLAELRRDKAAYVRRLMQTLRDQPGSAAPVTPE